MPTVIPYIPETITVHLGAPGADAANISVSFPDYVKNVASSEIYPTWEESALRANVLAIISFALNRVYTEFYRSQGYDFDITSSTAIDQKFINGRNYFQSITRIVDEVFNDYLRRQGFVEPLAAQFCNGTTVICAGLSQWGSQSLAQQGLDAVQILRRYYGSDIEIVADAPIRGYAPSYPGSPLRRGSRGVGTVQLQVMLNRISADYPSIPRINPVDGLFGTQTERAVEKFQSIFSLDVDGIVGKATWYSAVRIYVGVNRLSELESLGQTFYGFNWQLVQSLTDGASGAKVRQLQYMLATVSEYIDAVPSVSVDGIFGSATLAAVRAYQSFAGLTVDGVVGPTTWYSLYDRYLGIRTTSAGELQYPGTPLRPGDTDFG